MKYKVGDKVRIKSLDWYNENKDEYGRVEFSTHAFVSGMSHFCGKIVTIKDIFKDTDGNVMYYMEEIDWDWTDEMIECKVEEECPQDFIEKYCISCGTQRCDRTKEYLDGCPYYNEYVKAESNKYFQEYMNSLCKEHDEMIEGLMKDGTIVDYVKESNDRYRIVIDPRFNIEVDEGEYYAVRRKKEYPKTFLGCCDVLGIEDTISRGVKGYKSNLLDTFQKLLICRDAYWQIAGEEMELGKPWVPDYTKDRYIICRLEDKILKGHRISGLVEHFILEFPTTEMRDAFYENFKELIEQCKELL